MLDLARESEYRIFFYYSGEPVANGSSYLNDENPIIYEVPFIRASPRYGVARRSTCYSVSSP